MLGNEISLNQACDAGETPPVLQGPGGVSQCSLELHHGCLLSDRGFLRARATKQGCARLLLAFCFLSCPAEDPALQDVTSGCCQGLDGTVALFPVYFHFYFHLEESQLWELVLLDSPINGGSLRNLPLSRFVRVSVEKRFQSSATPT